MVTITDLKSNAEQLVTLAKQTAKRVQVILVEEDSILSETHVEELVSANARAEGAKLLLSAMEAANATKLDEETTKRLLRRFHALMLRTLDAKGNVETVGVIYDFITALNMVADENEYES